MKTHYLTRVSEEISRRGWATKGRMFDEDSLSLRYTIGNREVGLPELLMIGRDKDILVLDDVCEVMRRNNRPFRDGELIGLGNKFPLKSVNVSDEAKEEFTLQVCDYYRTYDYAVQQILLPDTSGRYPRDSQCEVPYCLVPVLSEWRSTRPDRDSNFL